MKVSANNQSVGNAPQSPSMTIFPLFVYGTLRKDVNKSMFHLLAKQSRFLGSAKVRGRLYDLGDYPGLVPSDEARWVRGEAYQIDDNPDVLLTLDRYEGCSPEDPAPHEFERVTQLAVLDDGTTQQVWVYVYRLSIDEKPEIGSGDYNT